MNRPVFLRYSQEALDREYNNREQRPNREFELFVKHCQERSSEARSKLNCFLDVAFGLDSAEQLDIFIPTNAHDAPVNIFFHGGYWRASSKDDFSYVALGGVPAGIVTLVVNYGLVPSVTMAELIRQCQRSIIWTFRNIGKYGGNPSNLYISGHSAGGHIVSMLLATPWREFDRDLPAEMFMGACAISGIYDLEPVRRTFLNATLKLTEADVAAFSSIGLVPVVRCPLLCAVGADESTEFIRQNTEFAERWKEYGLPIQTEILSGKDHFSIRGDLGEPTAPMSMLMFRHIQGALRQAGKA